MYRTIFHIAIVFLLVNCVKKDKLEVDISDIKSVVEVKRFEQDFYQSKDTDLKVLKEKYPLFFPVNTPDSVWVAKIKDTDEQELFNEVTTQYPNFDNESTKLSDLFSHVKYYYPRFIEPMVYTVMSNVDYQNNVIYADSLLFISLDVFLGANNKVYQDFPDYIKQNFTKDHLIIETAKKLAEREVPRAKDRTFVSRMIQRGKLLYLLDAFLPTASDAKKIGYTQEQIDWAEFNDVDVWKYFVEKELLFSNDQELNRRFLDPAPFSKFFLANDNETPGRIGEWFGWQIVRAYMNKMDASLQEMLQTDNEEIFKKSKYKPSK